MKNHPTKSDKVARASAHFALYGLLLIAMGTIGCKHSDVASPDGPKASQATHAMPPQGTPPAGASPNGNPPAGAPPGPPPNGAPPGPPPDGKYGGGPGGPGGPPPGGSSTYKLGGAFSVSNGSTKASKLVTYKSTEKDISAIYLSNGSKLVASDSTIITSGDSSSTENSSFFGLNAGVLAGGGSKIILINPTINTTGTGANGVFATDKGSSISIGDGSIRCTGGGGHAAMTSAGGSITLKNVNLTTTGDRGAPLATDRGGGTVTATGGTIRCAGFGSPAIYSTGEITVNKMDMLSTGSEGAVIEGTNTITINQSKLAAKKLWGVMVYQSFSGDAQGRKGTFTMNGGSLSAAAGPLFYVTNTNGTINLTGVQTSEASGVLLNAGVGRWGQKGSNGGQAILNAVAQKLAGDLVAEPTCSILVNLQKGSALAGGATNAGITLDSSSHWNVTKDSSLTSLVTAGGVGNIIGNGHKVTYQANLPANKWLGGKTFTLAKGGTLAPK